jgi:hypothetical protein
MSHTASLQKNGNGKSNGSGKSLNGNGKSHVLVVTAPPAVVEEIKKVVVPPAEETKPELVIAEVKKVVPKELTLQEKINKIENLQLVVEKRERLVTTRAELEKFQISSNDFNCSLRLNDSDGNVFTSSFTPGVKKVIDFLKSSFDESIAEVETRITF